MATQAERDICTASPGKYVIVQVDPRDHMPILHSEAASLNEVRTILNRMLYAECEVMRVFDDKGVRINPDQ